VLTHAARPAVIRQRARLADSSCARTTSRHRHPLAATRSASGCALLLPACALPLPACALPLPGCTLHLSACTLLLLARALLLSAHALPSRLRHAPARPRPQEFVERRSQGGALDGAALGKHVLKRRRREVDRKASKGRKISYEVHPKLQNFMFPADGVQTVAVHELFAHVFGITEPRN
jgi:hypothetical protein